MRMLDGVIDEYDGLSQAVSLSIYRLLRYAGECRKSSILQYSFSTMAAANKGRRRYNLWLEIQDVIGDAGSWSLRYRK